MKYRKISLIALSAALLLSGCNTDKAVTTTSDTAAVTEEVTMTEAMTTAAATTTSTTTTTEAPQTYEVAPKYEKLSDAAETVSEYDFDSDIKPLLDKYGITYSDEAFCGAMRIGKYAVLENRSGDSSDGEPVWGGLTLLSEEGRYEIDRDDLPAFGGLYYFIYRDEHSRDCLGIYEEYTRNGYRVLAYYDVLIKETRGNLYGYHIEYYNADGEEVRSKGFMYDVPRIIGEYGAYSHIAEHSDGKVYTTEYDLSWNGKDCKKPSWEMRAFKTTSDSLNDTGSSNIFYEADVPNLAGQIAIFEKAFYGSWGENEDGSAALDLTYGKSYFYYENPCYALAESDDAYYLFSWPGGEAYGLVIRKDEPDKMYISPQFGEDITESKYYGHYSIDERYTPYHKRGGSPDPKLELGDLNVFGQMKVEAMLGEKFSKCFNKCMEKNRVFNTDWFISGGPPSPSEEHILIELSDSKAVIAIKYMFGSDLQKWQTYYDDYNVRVMFIAYTFEKDENGDWSVTGREPYSAVTSTTGGIFTVTDSSDERSSLYAGYDRSWASVKQGDKLNGGKLTVTAAGEDNAGPGRYLYCTGEVTLKGLIRRVMETLDFEVETKGDLFFYPFPESLGDLPLILDGSGGYSLDIPLDDGGVYLCADTVELFLGNNESQKTYTRLPDDRYGHAPQSHAEYSSAVDAFTGEYYIAELTFSDLYMLYYPCIMSGVPNSTVNIKRVGEYEPVTKEELVKMFGDNKTTEYIDELKALTDDLLRFEDICVTRYTATDTYTSEDGKYDIYEFGDIKKWGDLRRFAEDLFSGEAYYKYFEKPYVERESEYADSYITVADGKIGVLRDRDVFVPHAAEYDSGDITIISASDERCTYKCGGRIWEGNTNDGYFKKVQLIITAKKKYDSWEIVDYRYPKTENEEELDKELGALLEKNREFYEMFIWGEGYELGENTSGSVYRVTFDDYRRFYDLWYALYSTYTTEYWDKLLNDFNGNGKSFWSDENGTWVDIGVFGAGGINAFRYGKDSYTYKITAVTGDAIEFDISYRVWNGYGVASEGVPDGDDTIVTRHCKAANENGMWKLPYMVFFDDDEQ